MGLEDLPVDELISDTKSILGDLVKQLGGAVKEYEADLNDIAKRLLTYATLAATKGEDDATEHLVAIRNRAGLIGAMIAHQGQEHAKVAFERAVDIACTFLVVLVKKLLI